MVHHVAQQNGISVNEIRTTDRVIIPARDEGGTITATLNYVLHTGFTAPQVVVVDSCSQDDTVLRTKAVGVTNIVSQTNVFRDVTSVLDAYGLDVDRALGKGAALWSGIRWLHNGRLPDDARVFFLDADIRDIEAIDPLGHLLLGWQTCPEASVVKLAQIGKNSEGIIATLNVLRSPYKRLAQFIWPLCGQQAFRFGTLRRLRFTTGYSVEMALLFGLIEQEPLCTLCEVDLRIPLMDERRSEAERVAMFTSILLFVHSVTRRGGLCALTETHVAAYNRSGRVFAAHLPQAEGGTRGEQVPADGILPSMDELGA